MLVLKITKKNVWAIEFSPGIGLVIMKSK
jgi:hypothetical protein